MRFLPITKEEIEERGWSQLDFVLISGDAYVDHPSFGIAIIGRVLERYGYKVGVISQPNWKDIEDFKKLGKPRLGFLITGGNVDSMVNNYSVFKNKRKKDEYSPGGKAGKRPDRATIVYSQRAREAFKGTPIIIGGIEASLRRFAHYDYWENKVRKSILLDSKADILIYGMGEKTIIEVAEALDSGIEAKDISWIRGTCIKSKEIFNKETLKLPSFDKVFFDKKEYCKSFLLQYKNNDSITAKPLAEEYEQGTYIIQNPPQEPLEENDLDQVYNMNFKRTYHPIYESQGGVPAIKEVKFSVTSNRGCFGGCSFCAITYHQGRQVRSRSKESIVDEAKEIILMEDFKGYIHDVGGPTANFRKPACKKQLTKGVCANKDCLFPSICKEAEVSHEEYLDILKSVRVLPGVKKVFIRSGIRYDYLMADKNKTFIEELCKHHVSGTLKVAPEHVSSNVLKFMRKPKIEVFEEFSKQYKKTNEKLGKKQYLIPYLISSHPGSTLEDAIEMALYLKKYGFIPDQVQDFYPTPGTLSTCMYYTELDPFTLEKIYVPKTLEEKKMQRSLLHFKKHENKEIVIKALKKAKREDLIDELTYKVSRDNKRGKERGRKKF